MQTHELVSHLNTYLNVEQFKDYAPNGLQVEGRTEIKKIITGVTACQALLDVAVEKNADAILVHHGYFWKGEEPTITGVKRQRLATLLKNNMNLLAYHLPLDAHQSVGNNVELAKLLGFQGIQFLDGPHGLGVGCKGELFAEQSVVDFTAFIAEKLQRQPQVIKVNEKPIKTLAWCTGGAQNMISFAAEHHVDAFISGEISEQTFHLAQELGIHYFACGHHATERYGIKALGEYLADRFELDVEFIDIDNPV